MSGVPHVVTIVAALGCGLNAGVFFTFSSFVMAALKRLPPARGIAAMQSINVLAVTPAFMSAFFGTALVCLGLAVRAVVTSGDRPTALLLGGSALYLIGAFGVTITRNVPMNNRLNALDAEDPASASYWDEYLSRWTAWNHVRTVASLAAALLFTTALTT